MVLAPPKLNEIPFPEYEGNEEKVIKIYEKHWKRIEKEILSLSEIPDGQTRRQLGMQREAAISRLQLLFYELRKEMGEAIPEMVTDAYLAGLAYTAITAGVYTLVDGSFDKTLTAAKKDLKIAFKPSKQRYVSRMVRDLQTDLLKTTKNTENFTKRIVRESFAKVMSEETLRAQKRSEIARKVKEEITKRALKSKLEGNIALIDSAGRRWSLDRYVKMAVKTKVNNVYFDGIREQAKEEGMDLAIINSHPLTVDACKKFEGMIISLNGDTKGYFTYEQLKASKKIFHPNCRHFARPIPGIDFVPKEYLRKHERQMVRQVGNKL